MLEADSRIPDIKDSIKLYLLLVRNSWNAVIASEAKQSRNYQEIKRLLCHFVPRIDR